MLQKPTILTGEVKEFTDLITYEVYDNGTFSMSKAIDNYLLTKTLKEFLNQNFDPSMITEYFKGWEDANDIFVNALIEEDIFINNLYNLVIGDWEFPFPKTLAQYITFCLSVDIKLEWKQ